MVTITHRLDHLKNYDQIILLQEGEIAEKGSYQELAKMSNGKLRNLLRESEHIFKGKA